VRKCIILLRFRARDFSTTSTGCGGEGEGDDHRDSRVATHKVFEARQCTPQAFANTIHINAQYEGRGKNELGRGIESDALSVFMNMIMG